VCISDPKLSFDAMTIVGNLNRDNAQALSKFMSVEPQIRLWDILQTKFKAKALQEKVYIEYDKVKADSWDRRNMRIEFNPNKLTRDEMIWLKQNRFCCKVKNHVIFILKNEKVINTNKTLYC
jgi:hypothetical protein